MAGLCYTIITVYRGSGFTSSSGWSQTLTYQLLRHRWLSRRSLKIACPNGRHVSALKSFVSQDLRKFGNPSSLMLRIDLLKVHLKTVSFRLGFRPWFDPEHMTINRMRARVSRLHAVAAGVGIDCNISQWYVAGQSIFRLGESLLASPL